MKAIDHAFRGLICLITLGVLSSQPAPQGEPPASKTAEKSGLIRMDLLRLSRAESSPFRRNLFAPGPAFGAPAPPLVQGSQIPKNRQEPQDFEPTGEDVATEVVQPAFNINLHYIGFIVSPRRLIALILLGGQALAVAEGEVVSEGVRIGKISVDEIEIILPDSSTRKFSLEGE